MRTYEDLRALWRTELERSGELAELDSKEQALLSRGSLDVLTVPRVGLGRISLGELEFRCHQPYLGEVVEGRETVGTELQRGLERGVRSIDVLQRVAPRALEVVRRRHVRDAQHAVRNRIARVELCRSLQRVDGGPIDRHAPRVRGSWCRRRCRWGNR